MKRFSYIICILGVFVFQSFKTERAYVHSFSETKFEANIANFYILGPKQYDDTGKDISVGYRSNSQIELTHYIYPSIGQNAFQHFQEYKNSLLTSKRSAKLIVSTKVTTRDIPGNMAKFEFIEDFHGLNQKVFSYLYIYESKGWFTMIRASCKATNAVSVEKEISEYLSSMPFPTSNYK
jgi:hypothetical protein